MTPRRTSSPSSQRACAKAPAHSGTCTSCSRTTATKRATWGATRNTGRCTPPRSGTTTCTTRCTSFSPARSTVIMPTMPTAPLRHFGRSLAEGFAYQGETSRYRGGVARGEPSVHLPPAAFVAFLQTHDQVGNRAQGERIAQLAEPRALRAAIACVLLAPSPPLLFMGEEFAASAPFLFFCDFGPELAAAVTQGRRREFARFARFSRRRGKRRSPIRTTRRPSPVSKLDWRETGRAPHEEWLALYRTCLHLRSSILFPASPGCHRPAGLRSSTTKRCTSNWTLGDGSLLHLIANFGATLPHRIRAAARRCDLRDGPGSVQAPASVCCCPARCFAFWRETRERCATAARRAAGIGLEYRDAWDNLAARAGSDLARAARRDGG